ncbi:MAG: ester cyclase [Chloroflexota bacterium]|nr:ester cyclase [Chloroflexota bacterium]
MKQDSGKHQRRRTGLILATAMFIACLLAFGLTRIPTVSEAGSANTGTTHQFFGLLNGQDDADMEAMYTDDAVIQSPEGQFVGPAGSSEFMTTLTDAFPTASFTIQRLERINDTIVAQWTMAGVQYGPYQGRDASCAGVAMNGVAVIQFEDQLIDNLWIHYDRLSIVRQIESFRELDPGTRPTCRNR